MTAGALALSPAEQRVAERISEDAVRGLTVSDHAGGVSFSNAGQLLDFAKMMAVANSGVRKHLRGNPGACLAICTQAVEWGLSPFAVANKSYFVNDQIAFESQLVQAVILKRAPIKGRIKFEFTGDGAQRVCRAWARLAEDPEEVIEYVSPAFGMITPKNSPLWKSDPDQQHAYYSGRALCRRHFPDVLLGVYADDELGPETARGPRDVTPPRTMGGRLDALAARRAPGEDAVSVGDEPPEIPANGPATPQASEDAGDIAPAAPGPHVGEGAGQQPAPASFDDEEGEADPTDPDYVKGAADRKAGRKKCLVQAILDDEARLANWRAGYESAGDEEA